MLSLKATLVQDTFGAQKKITLLVWINCWSYCIGVLKKNKTTSEIKIPELFGPQMAASSTGRLPVGGAASA